MKKILTLLLISFWSFGQKKIIYERSFDYFKVINKANYLTQEEKDRMTNTWRNDKTPKQRLILTFDDAQSHYTYENQEGKSEDGSYTWRLEDFVVYRNFAENKTFELHETLGKSYYIEDEIPQMKWKIGNEIKEVAGYVCMNATMYDSVKKQKLMAWFSTDIPESVGPERFSGLPGAILELIVDDEAVVTTAVFIDLKSSTAIPEIPKAKRAKKITNTEFDQLIADYISVQEKRKQYPWAMRY